MSAKGKTRTLKEKAKESLIPNVRSKVVPRREPRSSIELSRSDLEFYRAQLRQRLHREMRRVFERLNKEEGLTFSEIARRLGVNRSVVTRRFKGRTNLTLDVLSDMFRAMGARPNFVAELYKDLRSDCPTWSNVSVLSQSLLAAFEAELANIMEDNCVYISEGRANLSSFGEPQRYGFVYRESDVYAPLRLEGFAAQIGSDSDDVQEINLLKTKEGNVVVDTQTQPSKSAMN